MNVFLWILGIIALLLLFILSLKATVIIEADESVRVFLKVLFVKIKLVPSEKKPPDPSKFDPKRHRSRLEKEKKKQLEKQKKQEIAKEKKKKKKEEKKQKEKENPKKKMSASEIIDLISLVGKLAGTFFSRFAKRLRLDFTKIHVTVGGEDASSVAISYGIICQSVAYLVEILDRITNVRPKKDKDIRVYADFLSDKMTMDIKISASLRVWHLFDMLFSVAIRFVKEKILKI